ncbi:MAG TPA: PLP-dependent aminotransferase family protein [Bacillota bacterium]|jgi:2-aminoadipate transaminase
MFEDKLSAGAKAFGSSALAGIFALLEEPDLISFGGGFPDPSWFIPEIAEITSQVLATDAGKALQYCTVPGIRPLREFLAERSVKMGIKGLEAPNVLITAGSLQGLDLVCRVFLNPGDVVITEGPTYVGAIECFHCHQARVETVPLDDDGVDLQALDDLLRRLEREGKPAKLFYTVPSFQNPSGATMSDERRRKLVETASRHGLPVVEDNAYSELCYEGAPPPAIKAFDQEGLVISLGTFSKIFAPGVRLGWIIASPDLIERFILFKQIADQCSGSLGQVMALECGRRGLIETQIARSVEALKVKAAATLKAIEDYFPPGSEHTVPVGGFYTWVTVDERLDLHTLMPRIVKEVRVGYVTGTVFYPDGRGRRQARLSYSLPPVELIPVGLKRLGEFLSEELARA